VGDITQRDSKMSANSGKPDPVRPLLKGLHRFIGNTATGYIRSQGGHPAT
jgi:hypothetical protein